MGSDSDYLQRASSGAKQLSSPVQHGFLQHYYVDRQPEANSSHVAVSPVAKNTLESSGQPLDTGTLNWMESRFGHDFSNVRVHTDTQAEESAASVHSLAYTIGQDIVFGAGQYAPGTTEGKRLLAHELTHVVQQGKVSGNPSTGKRISQAGDAAEREAAHVAQSVMHGGYVPQSQIISTGMGIQRDDGGTKAPAKVTSKLVDAFATKFPDAAKQIYANTSAMSLIKEAEAAGAEFGGYSEDGPAKWNWPYTEGNKVYVPKASTDKIRAMRDFLFELNNAIRKPKFKVLDDEASKGSKGKLTGMEYARKNVELEVEGMLRLGEVWFETKKASKDPKSLDKYDADYFLSEYEAFKAKKKSKDDIINDVLKRKYTTGKNKGKTVEQFYEEEYKDLSGGK